MSFIPFEHKGKIVTKSVFDASALAMTSYADNAEIVGKALAIQCLVEGNAKPAVEFFAHPSFKKTDGKMTIRAMRLARYLESLVYGYMRIGREGTFAIVAGKKEKTEKRGFYKLGDKADAMPSWPVTLHDGRPKSEEVAGLVVNVHGFTEFEEFNPTRERPSTEVSAVSEAVTLRKFGALVEFFDGKNIENLSVENRDKLVGMCDKLLGAVVNASGKPLVGFDADSATVNHNNGKNVVNTLPRSRVALEAEVKNLSDKVRILEALEPEKLRSQRDAARVEAERLAKEVELKNLILKWQDEVIRCMQAGESATQALAMLQSYQNDLRETIGDSALQPIVEPVATDSVGREKPDESGTTIDELPEVAKTRAILSKTSHRAKQATLEAAIKAAGLPFLTVPQVKTLIKAAGEHGDFGKVLADYMAAYNAVIAAADDLDKARTDIYKGPIQPAAQ